MKLLLFGGTFDPPHIGHMSILKNAIDCVMPDEVWVMPAGIPPHKRASNTPANLRLEMCQCFSNAFPNIVISDWEIQQQGKSYTYNTVQWLQKQYTNVDVFLCIGSDMLLSFTTWHCWQDLLNTVILVVQCRTYDDIVKVELKAKEFEQQGANICLIKAEVEEISSTWLRKELAEGKDVFYEIPPVTADIIRKNHLYGVK